MSKLESTDRTARRSIIRKALLGMTSAAIAASAFAGMAGTAGAATTTTCTSHNTKAWGLNESDIFVRQTATLHVCVTKHNGDANISSYTWTYGNDSLASHVKAETGWSHSCTKASDGGSVRCTASREYRWVRSFHRDEFATPRVGLNADIDQYGTVYFEKTSHDDQFTMFG